MPLFSMVIGFLVESVVAVGSLFGWFFIFSLIRGDIEYKWHDNDEK